MTAAVLFAGGIYGEGQAMGFVPEMTEEALTNFLVGNFRSGVAAGKAKVERVAAQMGVDPLTGRPPEAAAGPEAMPEEPTREQLDNAVNTLGTAMARACDIIQSTLRPGAPYKVTVFARNTEDVLASAICGDDNAAAAIEGMKALIKSPSIVAKRATTDGVSDFGVGDD
jgi:hypothetical protein